MRRKAERREEQGRRVREEQGPREEASKKIRDRDRKGKLEET